MASPRRPIRIANCSGASPDPPSHMLAQATAGPVDVITGDYLAEANLGQFAEAYRAGRHAGWLPSAQAALELSLPALAARRIKVVVNGGGLNPRGLAEHTHRLAAQQGLDLKVAYVEGDDLLPQVRELLRPDAGGRLPHLDGANEQVRLARDTDTFLDDPDRPVVSANAYLGCRGIRRGLERGADIVICGRVADASPVMGAAAWWHGWADDAFDALAGALVAGHLIECSTYGTGANYAGFDEHPPARLLDLGCPIAEVDHRGGAVVTKHAALGGLVTADVVKCQLLYELQGTLYLNSDVAADLADVALAEAGPDRVRVSGARGRPPPPTTKLAVFYRGGWQGELSVHATGYAVEAKYDLQEAQLRRQLAAWDALAALDVLEFQRVGGAPAPDPRTQLAATTTLRIVAQARDPRAVARVHDAWWHVFMQHFAGLASTLDTRAMANPTPFLGYFPGLVAQARVREAVVFVGDDGAAAAAAREEVGPPRVTEDPKPRDSYDPVDARPLASFGPARRRPLGDVALARSGDKGGNVNVGFAPRRALDADPEAWAWLRALLTRARLREMMADDWRDGFHVERVEFPRLHAVHFVVYGLLGRGVCSTVRLDSLGKGFAEWLRAVHVPVPVKFLEPRGGSKL
ncbi:hypothetical protein F4780DRAFT_769273 [Xylariomycetidae sp. FL0641]|nr:hypothetical protein F4780DRAFT_769273 [Xylariomycetidae sp. FL0641]